MSHCSRSGKNRPVPYKRPDRTSANNRRDVTSWVASPINGPIKGFVTRKPWEEQTRPLRGDPKGLPKFFHDVPLPSWPPACATTDTATQRSAEPLPSTEGSPLNEILYLLRHLITAAQRPPESVDSGTSPLLRATPAAQDSAPMETCAPESTLKFESEDLAARGRVKQD